MNIQPISLRLITHAGVVGTATALLVACGGGGGNSNNATSDPPAGSPSPAPASKDPIDKYAATIVLNCVSDDQVTLASTGAPLNRRQTYTLEKKASPTKALFEVKREFFTASDCSGAPAGTAKVADDNTFLQIDGAATVSGSAVDKVTVSQGVYFPGFSFGTSLSMNGVKYTGAPYNQQTPQLGKDILRVQGSDLYSGTGSSAHPSDAEGYPTEMAAAPIGKIQ